MLSVVKNDMSNCCNGKLYCGMYATPACDHSNEIFAMHFMNSSHFKAVNAVLHFAVFLATSNATTTTVKHFKFAEGVSHNCKFFCNLQHAR